MLLAVLCVSAPPQGNSCVCTSCSLAVRRFRGKMRAFVSFIGGKGGNAAISVLHPAGLLILKRTHCTTRIACVLGASKCPWEWPFPSSWAPERKPGRPHLLITCITDLLQMPELEARPRKHCWDRGLNWKEMLGLYRYLGIHLPMGYLFLQK